MATQANASAAVPAGATRSAVTNTQVSTAGRPSPLIVTQTAITGSGDVSSIGR